MKKIIKNIPIIGEICKKIYLYVKSKYNNYIFNKNSECVLKKFKDILNDKEIVCWLDFGTLLGAIREADFIQGDNDIDLGVKIEDREKVYEILTNNNIKRKRAFYVDNVVVEETYKYKGVLVDIFYYFKNDNKLITHCFDFNDILIECLDNKKIIKNIDILQISNTNTGFDLFKFKGDMYYIPKDYKKYLSENYGHNYMIPNKEWNSLIDPPNIKKDTNRKGVCIYD